MANTRPLGPVSLAAAEACYKTASKCYAKGKHGEALIAAKTHLFFDPENPYGLFLQKNILTARKKITANAALAPDAKQHSAPLAIPSTPQKKNDIEDLRKELRKILDASTIQLSLLAEATSRAAPVSTSPPKKEENTFHL